MGGAVRVAFRGGGPNGKRGPGAGLKTGGTVACEAQVPSTAVAAEETVAEPTPLTFCVMFAGSVSVGGVVSWIVTLNDPELVLPAASVAVQLTAVVPYGKETPEL